MTVYAIRRVTLLLPTVLGLVTAVFILVRVIPGDTVTALMADSGQFSEAQIAELRSDWRLDDPLHEQYLTYMGGILTGDMGRSFYFNTSVREEIQQRLFPTLEIAVLALAVGIAIAIPLGVLAAVQRGGVLDALVRSFAVLGQALPNFWIATLVIVGLGSYFRWLPPKGFVYPWEDPFTNIQQVILPALILGWSLAAVLTRMTRNSMLEVLTSDYVRTARAKGLGSREVNFRHAARNACIPVLTLAGVQFAFLLGGSVIVETLFTVPGVGSLLLRAIEVRDYNLIQGIIIVFGFGVMVTNLVVDLTYSLLDPRVAIQ